MDRGDRKEKAKPGEERESEGRGKTNANTPGNRKRPENAPREQLVRAAQRCSVLRTAAALTPTPATANGNSGCASRVVARKDKQTNQKEGGGSDTYKAERFGVRAVSTTASPREPTFHRTRERDAERTNTSRVVDCKKPKRQKEEQTVRTSLKEGGRERDNNNERWERRGGAPLSPSPSPDALHPFTPLPFDRGDLERPATAELRWRRKT